MRIGLDRETTMACAGFGFSAGEAEVVFAGSGAKFDHPETPSDDIGGPVRSERSLKRVEIDPRDFEIEIFGLNSEEPIAHAASDDARATHFTHGFQNRA